MANIDFQWGGLPAGPGSDIAVVNIDAVDLREGQIVVLDAAHVLASNGGTFGVRLPTADGGGIAMLVDNIPKGRVGRARLYGIGVGIADGPITAGARVRGSDVRPGGAKACTGGQAQFGYALNTVADGDPVPILIDRANNA